MPASMTSLQTNLFPTLRYYLFSPGQNQLRDWSKPKPGLNRRQKAIESVGGQVAGSVGEAGADSIMLTKKEFPA